MEDPPDPPDAAPEAPEAEGIDGDDDKQQKCKAYWPTLLVHRRLVGEGDARRWVRCQGYDDDHQMDSRVHYYDREHGFDRGAEHRAALDRSSVTREAFARRRENPEKRTAHWKTVERWSMFERWVLAMMPSDPYATFLRACDNPVASVAFQAPTVALVVTFMDEIRQFPLKANTVKTYLAAISSTCTEFGATSPCGQHDVKLQLSTQACGKSDTDDTDVNASDTRVKDCMMTRMSMLQTPMSGSDF